jgi:hypothetical protein
MRKYDVVKAGKKEYAKLTPEQRLDRMEGVKAAVRGIFAVADEMYRDSKKTKQEKR